MFRPPADATLLPQSVDSEDVELPVAPVPRCSHSSVRYSTCAIMAAALVYVSAVSGGHIGAAHSVQLEGFVGFAKKSAEHQHSYVQMTWVANMSKCVGVKGGLEAAKKTVHLTLQECTGDALTFTVPTADDPLVRVAGRPELCVDNPGKTALQLWLCEDDGAEANMNIFLRADSLNRTRGTVRPLKNSSRCMDAPRDEIGAPVQMWECMNSTHELFMLNITSLETIEQKDQPVGEPQNKSAGKHLRHAHGKHQSKSNTKDTTHNNKDVAHSEDKISHNKTKASTTTKKPSKAAPEEEEAEGGIMQMMKRALWGR
jgi:hypothetical protein